MLRNESCARFFEPLYRNSSKELNSVNSNTQRKEIEILVNGKQTNTIIIKITRILKFLFI